MKILNDSCFKVFLNNKFSLNERISIYSDIELSMREFSFYSSVVKIELELHYRTFKYTYKNLDDESLFLLYLSITYEVDRYLNLVLSLL